MKALLALAAALPLLGACGQKGPLYLPDKNAAVVTSAPAATAPGAPANATPRAKKTPGQDEDPQPPQ